MAIITNGINLKEVPSKHLEAEQKQGDRNVCL
jgi:hypothetical protein